MFIYLASYIASYTGFRWCCLYVQCTEKLVYCRGQCCVGYTVSHSQPIFLCSRVRDSRNVCTGTQQNGGIGVRMFVHKANLAFSKCCTNWNATGTEFLEVQIPLYMHDCDLYVSLSSTRSMQNSMGRRIRRIWKDETGIQWLVLRKWPEYQIRNSVI